MTQATRRCLGMLVWVAAAVGVPAGLGAQVLSLAKGATTVVTAGTPVARVSIGDPSVADYAVISPREVMVTGKGVGTTSLIVWESNDARRVYTVEVGVDVASLNRQIQTLFPGERVTASASGTTVILSGSASSGIIARRIGDFARSTGATVLDNMNAPPSPQILLRVRFAEMSRTATRNFDVQARVSNPDRLSIDSTFAENLTNELLHIAVFNATSSVDVLIQALKSNGLLQILAEPNLLALDGQEASFLAGGEFPYTVVQNANGAGGNGTVTVQFKEFGVRLRFTPVITGSGNIRLQVAPEVSQLDFTNAVVLSGFTIPALRTRRASTTVELRPGQTLAIAGLLDNSIDRNVSKIPILGDIPILGLLFRSTSYQQRRSELVVLVSPELVSPSDGPLPVPTGEPGNWNWERSLRQMGPPRDNRPAPQGPQP
jgi:pilus assembly protein CpaC